MWTPPDEWSYAYLLGIYLGDGCIQVPPRGNPNLFVSLDSGFPGIVDDVVASMTLVTGGARRVSTRPRPGSRCVVARASAPEWLQAFPQHGPGQKHHRPIVLGQWQREVLSRHPQPFLRGLIHSDGCRTVNRFKTRLPSGRVAEYEYVRYFFSNYSTDIRDLFCEYCERLGIRWTQSNPRNISVAHRGSVARLESFVGIKS